MNPMEWAKKNPVLAVAGLATAAAAGYFAYRAYRKAL